jgi:hypothetical protein
MKSGAVFSDDKKYRYSLWRDWDAHKVLAMFIMLNPSTADEVKNDPTIERCERRVKVLGYGGLTVCNLFALRSTDPKALYEEPNPVGILNNFYIKKELNKSGLVVCGWGAHGKLHNRQEEVLKMITESGHKPHLLVLNKDGTPKHPLYVSYDTQIKEWPHD